jgi:predicted metal-dependent hydrolase
MKTKDNQPDIMERMRAAVCICNTQPHRRDMSLFAFLSIMHPEMSLERRLKLAHLLKYGEGKG